MVKDASYYENKIFTIPNILSFFRLALIPIIVWLYCFEEKFAQSALIIILSGITDIVDGFIARRFNMISNFGKFIDPFADKMTQFVLMVCLTIRYPYMLFLVVLLFIKEFVALTSAFIAYKKSGIVKGAEWHGKLSTVLLYSTIFLHIVWVDIMPIVSYSLVIACIVMMVVSFFLYELRHLKLIFRKA